MSFLQNFRFANTMHPVRQILKTSLASSLFRKKISCSKLFLHRQSSVFSQERWLNTNTCSNKQNKNLLAAQEAQTFQKKFFTEDRETKALTVWGSVKHLKNSPLPALALGAAGLIPLVAAPGYMILFGTYMPSICLAQMTYGATILSFLGGVKWGLSIAEDSPLRPDWINLGVSVLPSLVAWVGLLCPYPMSIFVVMGGLAGIGYYDMATYGYPPWFKGLRFVLTFVALLALWTTFMCSFLLKKETVEESSAQT